MLANFYWTVVMYNLTYLKPHVYLYRLNQKNWKQTFVPFVKVRKIIETIFSQLIDMCLSSEFMLKYRKFFCLKHRQN